MIHAELESLLKRAMGLDAASVGSMAIKRAINERRTACKLHDAQAYWEHVRASPAELQELIEAVVVPETWFFRDREAFRALGDMGAQRMFVLGSPVPMRLLSLPCSSGEEPYSMAMALFDSGVTADAFRIDAVDISARALERAGRALYGKNSFRGNDLGFRERYFQATPQGSQLSGLVQKQVSFRQGNIFAADFLPGSEIYDAIFCRNLLIYFDRATQDRTVSVLQRLLRSSGRLFIGPSESSLLVSHGFISAKLPLAFAFCKPGAAAAVGAASPRRMRRVARRDSAQPITSVTAAPRSRPNEKPSSPAESAIEMAIRHANQGRFAEAQECCERHLRETGPSAHAFYLSGVIREAAGAAPDDAAGYYRKALYLEPTHHEALAHLALLLEKAGDKAGAERLRQRARRLDSDSLQRTAT